MKGWCLDIKKFQNYAKLFFQRGDIFLLCMCLICAFFGIVMVYITAAGLYNGGWNISSPSRLIIVQVFSMFLGVFAFVVFTYIDADLIGRQWKWLCIINVLLLIALVIFGQEDGTGNKSWIRFGGIGIQPSEIIKVIYIVVAAYQMNYLKDHNDINSFSSVVQMAAHLLIVFGAIVVVSSDLGSAAVILCIFLAMFFALGVRLYWFAIGGAAVAAAIPLIWNYFLKDYQKQRLVAPYDPTIDPSGYGITWQTNQSKLALASGRLQGVGAEHNTTIFTGKHTDFIFSSVGEQLGMIGCIIVLILLTILVFHCARVGIRSGRTYDMLICVGVAASVEFQLIINVGMCIGITPVIGITLPFFSYGGSSMMTMFAAMGLVSGVKYKPKPQLFSMMY